MLPTSPAPITAIVCGIDSSFSLLRIARRARCVMLQKRNMIVAPLASADIALTIRAACCGPANIVKKRDIIMNSGAPGGCPTSSLYEVAMNSLQSQKLAVGSMVSR